MTSKQWLSDRSSGAMSIFEEGRQSISGCLEPALDAKTDSGRRTLLEALWLG
jgi:hypothetical protein